MHIKNKRGQSTVEYILLVTAVVAVMIVFATTQNGGFQSQLNSTLNTATADMNTAADTLSSSHSAQAAPAYCATTENPPYSVPVAP